LDKNVLYPIKYVIYVKCYVITYKEHVNDHLVEAAGRCFGMFEL